MEKHLKPTNDGSKRRFGQVRGLALALTLAVLVGVLFGGCTSEDPNGVGTTLVTDQVDTILVPLGSEEIVYYTALKVENPDIPVHQQEVIYMGEQNGTVMGPLIANYDFDIKFTTTHPETLFTVENIKSVKFSLTKVKYYSAYVDTVATGQPVDLYYQVQEMSEPFDPALYVDYPPDHTPEAVGPILNSDFDQPNISSEPLLPFWDATELLDWIANRRQVGIMVNFGASSDPGLVGFASHELTKYNELDPLFVVTIPAPNFVLEFQDNTIPNFLLEPYADTSVFEEVPPPPASPDDGILLRTGLRSYPGIYFDLSALPANAFINRALLSVTNDTTVAFGNLSAISVLEWDIARFGDPYATIPLSDLDDRNDYWSFHVTGQGSIDPARQQLIQFDVTQAILRIVNEVYTGTRGFLLTGGEKFLPEGGFTSVTPDFYYREFRFMGSAAADPADRPQLKITYSLVDEINGEGE
jgi:hypothetical protein